MTSVWCSQCKTEKPETAFFPVKRRKWKVTYCDACARENMARYWRHHETDPDKVRRAGRDE